MTGFVTDYAAAITANKAKGWYVVPGTTEDMIMACHTPATLPVLNGLAKGFAVCDHWYCSAPTTRAPLTTMDFPRGATLPDSSPGEFGFDFTRFGPRVPTVLVSPLIKAGPVFRAPGPVLCRISGSERCCRRVPVPRARASRRPGAAPTC